MPDQKEAQTATQTLQTAPVDPEIEKLRLQLEIEKAKAMQAQGGGPNWFDPDQMGQLAGQAGAVVNTVGASVWNVFTQFTGALISGRAPQGPQGK